MVLPWLTGRAESVIGVIKPAGLLRNLLRSTSAGGISLPCTKCMKPNRTDQLADVRLAPCPLRAASELSAPRHVRAIRLGQVGVPGGPQQFGRRSSRRYARGRGEATSQSAREGSRPDDQCSATSTARSSLTVKGCFVSLSIAIVSDAPRGGLGV